ncbi:hypothetical protein NQZ79_g6618 [Umbelopsis isabellina]|nr:hypothetical protein NQZ79_g6618 [Umbelopsis isabellina]
MLTTATLPASAAWAPLFAGYSSYLTYRVIKARLQSKVLNGDGTSEELKAFQGGSNDFDPVKYKELRTAMRCQSNFVENVPLALILIVMLESNRVNTKAIHGLMGTLFVARVLHIHFGMFWNSSAIGSGRPMGMMLTNGVILVAGIWNGIIDINSIIYASIDMPYIQNNDTANYFPDTACIFNAYFGQGLVIFRSVLLLGLCLNLWMAVHRPSTNADREWFKWYLSTGIILALAVTLPVYFMAKHTDPNGYAETIYSGFTCYLSSSTVSSRVVTSFSCGLNVISMLLLFHTTYDVLRHKLKVNKFEDSNVERALQNQIVVRMMFCSIIAVVVVLWLDLEAIVDIVKSSGQPVTYSASSANGMTIFFGIVDALFYFSAFGTTTEFAKFYCCCLIPVLDNYTSRRRRGHSSFMSNRHSGKPSIAGIKASLQGSSHQEGEWQELDSIHETMNSKDGLSSHV